MRDALAGSSIEVSEDASVQLTASFGIAESNPDQTTDELLRRADDALYAAKRGGKNRYVIDATPTSRKAS
jgi:diguanylate cyclase (GGDEF)-like protein